MIDLMEQAEALARLLATGSEAMDPSERRTHALSLGRELLLCGEWRLCIELLTAAASADKVEGESALVLADAYLGSGDASAANEILIASGVLSSPEERDAALALECRVKYALNHVHEAWSAASELRRVLIDKAESSALGWSSFILGNISWARGEMPAASKYYVEAMASALRKSDLRLEALSTVSLANITRMRCHWGEALEGLERSTALWLRLGNRAQTAHSLRSTAIILWKRGQIDDAERACKESLRVATEGNNDLGVAYATQLQALIDIHSGDSVSARESLVQSQAFKGGGHASRVLLLASEFLGDVELEQGNPEKALAHYDQVLPEALARVPKGDIVAELRRRRAECFYLMGRHAEAYDEAVRGLEHCRELGDRYEEASTYRVVAMSAAAVGKADEVKRNFEQGLALFEDIETPYEWGKLWLAYGDWLMAQGQHQEEAAIAAYAAARELFERMGARARLAQAVERLGQFGKKSETTTSSSAATPPSVQRRVARRREDDVRVRWAQDTFGVLTTSPAMFELLEVVEKLARSRTPVLVLGESGTGKELIAQSFHRLSGNRGEFMAINCATLPRDVIESELFGHVAGSFTGATRDKVGLLEVCDGGTAFLDEIGEMSLDLQSRLLRFLEAGELRKVGATRITRVNTRIVAATNRENSALRAGQGFRQDLYYRLAHAVVQLPPLRRRGARDIELLAQHFLGVACKEERKRVELSPAALDRLSAYPWPGNIRELKATILQRVVLAHDGHEISPDELHLDAGGTPSTLGEELALTERKRIKEALRQSSNSKADAARLLGIPRTTLIHRMRRLGVE